MSDMELDNGEARIALHPIADPNDDAGFVSLTDDDLLQALHDELEAQLEGSEEPTVTEGWSPPWWSSSRPPQDPSPAAGDHVVLRMMSRDPELVRLLSRALSRAGIGFRLEVPAGRKSPSGIVEAMGIVEGPRLRGDPLELDEELLAELDNLSTPVPTRKRATRRTTGTSSLMLVHERGARGLRALEIKANLQIIRGEDDEPRYGSEMAR